MRTLMIPLDGSDLGEETLSYALERFSPQEARLLLFHCMDLNYIYANANASMLPPNFPELEQLDRQRNQAYLDEKVALAQKHGFEARSVLTSGNPVLRILKAADSEAVDQILVSTHGRSGIARLFMGSVAEGVIRRSTVPVLVVPSAARREAQQQHDPIVPGLTLP